MTELGQAILCSCDPSYRPDYTFFWCGRNRTDAYRIVEESTQWERQAAEALVPGVRKQRSKLIRAIHALDSNASADISRFSHLAAQPADREDYVMVYPLVSAGGHLPKSEFKSKLKEAAHKRHERRTGEALEQMVETCKNTRSGNLRRRIVQRLRELGVELSVGGYATSDQDNPCVGAGESHYQALMSGEYV